MCDTVSCLSRGPSRARLRACVRRDAIYALVPRRWRCDPGSIDATEKEIAFESTDTQLRKVCAAPVPPSKRSAVRSCMFAAHQRRPKALARHRVVALHRLSVLPSKQGPHIVAVVIVHQQFAAAVPSAAMQIVTRSIAAQGRITLQTARQLFGSVSFS